MENGGANEDLQAECGQITEVESRNWADCKGCSVKVVFLKNQSLPNNHHSPLPCSAPIGSLLTGRHGKDAGKSRIRNIVYVKGSDQGSGSKLFSQYIPSLWSYKATLTGIWDPGGIILEAKLLFFGSNNSLSLFSRVSILESAMCVESGMNYMSYELFHWDCVCKVFDKLTDTYWPTQMVIAFAKVDGVRFVGMMFGKMPQQDPMACDDTFEEYAQSRQLTEALFWYHERPMDMQNLVPMPHGTIGPKH